MKREDEAAGEGRREGTARTAGRRVRRIGERVRTSSDQALPLAFLGVFLSCRTSAST